MQKSKIFEAIVSIACGVAIGLVVSAWGLNFTGAGFEWKTSANPATHRILAFANGTIRYTYHTELFPDPRDDPARIQYLEELPANVVYTFEQPKDMVSTYRPVAVKDRGSYKHILISLYYPTLIVAAWLAISLRRDFRRKKIARRRERGLCLRCGYDLHGSSDRCPECGTRFEYPCLCSEPRIP